MWVTFRTVQDNSLNPINPFGLHILQIELTSLKIIGYYTETNKGEPLPNNLFITKNGELWGTGFFTEKNVPVLFHYDERNDRFDSVLDQDKTLLSDYGNIHAIADKFRNVIWISRNETADSKLRVYKFDLSTQKMEEDKTLSKFNSSNFIVSPDGEVWVSVSDVTQGWYIAKYNPDRGDIRVYYPPSEFTETPTWLLYYDHLGHIWMGDVGWLDLSYRDALWYKMIPSPYFIMSDPTPEVRYRMLGAETIFESSNGQLWFTGPQGLVRLSPDEGEWCLITSDHGSVYEDSSKNLWVVSYGVVYKRHLMP